MLHKIYWLTGLPGSGKTTLAEELAPYLNAEILDGDIIRNLSQNSDFSLPGREKHMRSVAYVASLLSKHTEVIVAMVSPIRSVREEIKRFYPNLCEVYLKCSLEVCKQRDPKGLYAKALKGEIKSFTGHDQPYEEPLSPDMMVETDKMSIAECRNALLKLHDFAPRALLVGRWQPFHEGHRWLIEEVRAKGYKPLIGIRHTPVNKENPFTVQERIQQLKKLFGDDLEYMAIPDINGIFYGRKVGYKVEKLEPPKHIGKISATLIRQDLGGTKD